MVKNIARARANKYARACYIILNQIIKPAGCNLFFANQRYEIPRKKCCPLTRK